jgi:ankyrin repeat protein
MALLLLEAGADMETRCDLDRTALYMASSCIFVDVDIVRQLIIHGADLNAECKDSGRYNNECRGTPPIVRVLLEHGASPNAPDNVGETALIV